jgi:hypothetical protein
VPGATCAENRTGPKAPNFSLISPSARPGGQFCAFGGAFGKVGRARERAGGQRPAAIGIDRGAHRTHRHRHVARAAAGPWERRGAAGEQAAAKACEPGRLGSVCSPGLARTAPDTQPCSHPTRPFRRRCPFRLCGLCAPSGPRSGSFFLQASSRRQQAAPALSTSREQPRSLSSHALAVLKMCAASRAAAREANIQADGRTSLTATFCTQPAAAPPATVPTPSCSATACAAGLRPAAATLAARTPPTTPAPTPPTPQWRRAAGARRRRSPPAAFSTPS